jgi:hypothetical protein
MMKESQMNRLALMTGLLIALTVSNARAGSISVTAGTTVGGNDLYEFFLDTTGSEGTFDTFELIVNSAALFNQVGAAGTPVAQPSEDSGFSQFLTAPANFGGFGLSEFGIIDTTSEVSGTHASLGDNAASDQGNYLVAQVVMTPGGSGIYQWSFFDDGDSTQGGGGNIGGVIPEPASMALVAFGLIGVIATRRRS